MDSIRVRFLSNAPRYRSLSVSSSGALEVEDAILWTSVQRDTILGQQVRELNSHLSHFFALATCSFSSLVSWPTFCTSWALA